MFVPILVNLIISIVSILANYKISKHTIETNRKLNAENAGKNRTIYGVEVMSADDKSNLKHNLESGSYTILNAYANPSAWNNTIIVLGKIRP